MRTPDKVQVLEYVRNHPDMTAHAITQGLMPGVKLDSYDFIHSKQAIVRSLQRLKNAGLVKFTKSEKPGAYLWKTV